MSSACACHTGEWCFYCEMYVPLERKHAVAVHALETILENIAHGNFDAFLIATAALEEINKRDKLKYDYTYFPENNEISEKQAQEMMAFISSGVLKLDPRMLEILNQYVDSKPSNNSAHD